MTYHIGQRTVVAVVLLFGLVGCANPTEEEPAEVGAAAGSISTASPSASASPTPTPTPVVEKRQVTEVQPVPFSIRRVNDASLLRGTEKVRTPGVAGEKTLTYEVTITGGVETDRRLLSETITKQPIAQVVAVGTKAPPAKQCHASYTGKCVPIASDVDCAGGSGDGPAYVDGPVTVVGPDVYRLDSDNDGIGCE